MVALCALLAWAPIVAVASYSCDASAELHAPSSPDGCDVIGELGGLSAPVGPCGVTAVGPQWSLAPVFEFGAYLETAAVDMDPIQTPTCRGTLCPTLAVSQAVLASRPTWRALCPVGATTKPCFRLDGGDFWSDAIARAALRFLHDGTGVTCVVVFETASAAQQALMFDGDTGGGAPGANMYTFNAQSYALIQTATSNATASTGALTSPLGQTHAFMFVDILTATPDTTVFIDNLGAALGAGASITPRSNADSLVPLTFGGNWAGASFLNGYLGMGGCWQQTLSLAQRQAAQAELEAYYGGTFPL